MIEDRSGVRSCLLVCLPVLTVLQAVASDEDLANERFVEPGKAIEVHWQIDCGEASTTASKLLTKLVNLKQADCASFSGAVKQGELDNLLDSLQKCGFIYNTPQSRRFQSCPDYALAHRRLASTTDACRRSPGKFTPRRELMRQAHAALECSAQP